MVKTDLFLTHDLGTDDKGRNNHERVSIINKELKTMGYRTWFDSDRMVGDIATQMASGIENTEAVLVFLTKRYMEKVIGDNPSDNCKLEFNHAVRKKTNNRMVCLVMEERMKDTLTWDGSIGMYLGGKIYIDMTKDLNNKTYLTQQLAQLEKELRGMNILPNKTNVEESLKDMSISQPPAHAKPVSQVKDEPSPLNGNTYLITNKTYSHANIAQWGTRGRDMGTYEKKINPDQYWRLEESHNHPGFYYIHNCHYQNYRIGKWGSGDEDVGIYGGDFYDDQLWKFVDEGNGYYRIYNFKYPNAKIAKWGKGDGDWGTYAGDNYDDQLWKLTPRRITLT